MAFPSTLSTFNRPSSTDRLNNPSHSDLHNTVSSALGQVEAVLGVRGDNSVLGTVNTTVFSPSSDGGGHVQSANKGGTGQTSFTKGDILIAQSASVLSKLAVGVDNQILKANSSVATGINWVDDSTPKVGISTAQFNVTNTTNETSFLSQSIPGSVLGTNNGVKVKIYISDYHANFISTTGALTLRMKFGVNTIATVTITPIGSTAAVKSGWLEFVLLANGSDSSQKGILVIDMMKDSNNQEGSIVGVRRFASGTSSIATGGAQTLVGTAQWADASTDNDFTVEGWVVEKIT